jgi:hypothetical protein
MDIKEIKELEYELQDEICELIKKYEEKTDLKVSKLKLIRSQVYTYDRDDYDDINVRITSILPKE